MATTAALISAGAGAASAGASVAAASQGPKSATTLTWQQQSIMDTLYGMMGQSFKDVPQYDSKGNRVYKKGQEPKPMFDERNNPMIDPKTGKQMMTKGVYSDKRVTLPMAQYKGPLQGALTPEYLRAEKMLAGYNPTMFMDQQSQAMRSVLSGKSAYDVSPEATANYYKDAVETPMLRTFDTEINPRIKEGFAGYGGFNSRQGIASKDALNSLQTNFTSGLGQAQMGNQQLAAQLAESAKARQMQGIGIATNLANQPIGAAQNLLQIGAPFQARNDQAASQQYQQWLGQQPQNNPMLNLALSLLGSQQQYVYNPNNLVSAGIGGGIQGASLAALLLPQQQQQQSLNAQGGFGSSTDYIPHA